MARNFFRLASEPNSLDVRAATPVSLTAISPNTASLSSRALDGGAVLALAKKGGRLAIALVRRHPLATAASALLLVGVGIAVLLAKRKASPRVFEGMAKRVPARKLRARKRLANTGLAGPASIATRH